MNPASANPICTVAVFCGSNFGTQPEYAASARAFGAEIARRGWRMVYGGTNKGLMGVVATAALEGGAQVCGVITQRLADRGHLAEGLTQHEIVPDMQARKKRMAELSDAFVALPGGLGTFEELFEAATLTQLGEHRKACGVLDTLGFFEPMRAMLEHAVRQGFIKREHGEMIVSHPDEHTLLDQLETWVAPVVTKWIDQLGA